MALSPFEQLIQPHNLYWAFRKAEALYERSDAVFDRPELARFQLFLEEQLDSIRTDFQENKYRLAPMRLLPLPKKAKDGNERMRQAFQFSVRDQVAWIALVNVLGPELDKKMPAWSYGNRLYRVILRQGTSHHVRYSRSSPQLYREFKNSWPLYRAHIAASARNALGEINSGANRTNLNDEPLPTFVKPGFWSTTRQRELYAVSLDLERFYPSVKLEIITSNLAKYSEAYATDDRIAALIDRLLSFRVDQTRLSDLLRDSSDPPCQRGRFAGIPTGLWTAGFLSNVAMLDLDAQIEDRTQQQGVAHFRFVDDYTILTQSFDKLESWTQWYQDALETQLSIKINLDKTTPPQLGAYLLSKQKTASLYSDAQSASEVKSPTQLATRTLTQISILDQDDFDLLSHDTQSERLEQLRLLLLQDVDEAEIRADTRMSFAATRLANLAPRLASSEIGQLKSAQIARRIASLQYQKQARSKTKTELKTSIKSLQTRLQAALLKEQDTRMSSAGRIFNDLRAAFARQPDKLTLLTGIIKFCRLSGFYGVRRILHPLLSHQTAQKRYLASVGLQTLARSAVLAVSTLKNPESLNREKTAAERHLTEISNFGNTPIEGSAKDRFYNDCWAFYRVALASAAQLLAGDRQHRLLAKALAASCRRLNAPLWPTLIRKSGPDAWPIWIFLFERLLIGQKLVGPSALWLRTAPKLSPLRQTHWQLLRLYPKHQPNLLDTIRARQSRWKGSDAGWLRDAVETYPPVMSDTIKRVPIISQVMAAASADDTFIGIQEWLRFSNEVERRNMFDPRCGEWTALEIFKSILIAATRTEIMPTPFNVLLDRRLTSPVQSGNGSPPTWQAWRSICENVPVKITKCALHDYRTVFTTMRNAIPFGYAPITYGLILGFLLSKSLALPDLWNLPGLAGARLGLVFGHIEHFAISSATNVILEQCLAPRYVEYRAESRLSRNQDLKLKRWSESKVSVVAAAQEILSQYQTTIQRYQSRQLIPVDIFQLRSQFSEVTGDNEG